MNLRTAGLPSQREPLKARSPDYSGLPTYYDIFLLSGNVLSVMGTPSLFRLCAMCFVDNPIQLNTHFIPYLFGVFVQT